MSHKMLIVRKSLHHYPENRLPDEAFVLILKKLF